MDTGQLGRGRALRAAEWLSAHARLVIAASLIATAALAVPMVTLAPDTSASQTPSNEIVDAEQLVSDRFASDVYGAGYLVEAVDGNMLARDRLLALYENTAALRADPETGPLLIEYFDPVSGVRVEGVHTIADEANAALASVGGLEGADEQQVAAAVAAIVAQSSPLDWGMAATSSFDPSSGSWEAPAFFFPVLADNVALGGGGQAITLGSDDTTKEEFARDVQAALRGDTDLFGVWGIAIDVNLTAGEQSEAAGPFIGFTILAVLIVTGIVLRSYWAVAVAGAALAALMIWLKGLSNLIGLESDQILSFVAPIAMISFGIDFAFHAVGRYREEAQHGYRPRVAFVTGLAGVMAALVLALLSDSVAFLSNVASGIESVVQFGIGAALALVAAFLMLGLVTPLVLMEIEERIPSRPETRTRRVGRGLASGLAATAAMTVVLFIVYILPAAGVAALALYVALVIWLPYRFAMRRDSGGAEPAAGRAVLAPRLGRGVEMMAHARWIVLPVVLAATVVTTLVALQIEARFDVKDFFAADTDLVQSLDKLDEHVGQRGGEPAMVYIEADLTSPEVLRTLVAFADDVADIRNPQLAVDDDGVTLFQRGVLDVIDDVMAIPFARSAVENATGVFITDADGDGLPDSREQLQAVHGFTGTAGVPRDGANLEWSPDAVGTTLWSSADESEWATVMMAQVVGSRSQENIAIARDDLEPLVERLDGELMSLDPDARAVITGSAIVRDEQLNAILRALAVALPLSVIACFVVAAGFMRSLRFAAISIVPILVVVSWLYAFMHVAGYGINVVTATIGAISIGIGIDFAIHFVMRYREELDRRHVRSEAVRAAGTGTGAALAASAASSVVGFAIMAFAPMPMFAIYGFLTAIMIAMALVATLLVLPGLLMWVTRDEPVVGRASVDEQQLMQPG